jgi:hypothetical protein
MDKILFVLYLLTIILLFIIILRKKKESFSCKKLNCVPPQDISHCPKQCSPFMYPDMYSPKGDCSNPFSWGFTYSTGRCPHSFNVSRRLPS